MASWKVVVCNVEFSTLNSTPGRGKGDRVERGRSHCSYIVHPARRKTETMLHNDGIAGNVKQAHAG